MAKRISNIVFITEGSLRPGGRINGLRCRLLPDCLVSTTEIETFFSLEAAEPEPANKSFTVIKSDRRTRVIRFQTAACSFFAKSFFMRCLKDSLRHRRYAYSEWKNNTLAGRRGIRTPQCYAYFEKRSWGLVRQCGLIMENLADYTEFTHLLQSGKRTIFDVIPILRELYLRGVNHIDISPKNIFIRESDGHFAIIDWQYCGFHPPENALQLCLMAAVFFHYIPLKCGDAAWHQWLEELFNQCRPAISREKMRQAVDIMQDKKLHWKARLSLDVSGLGVETIW